MQSLVADQSHDRITKSRGTPVSDSQNMPISKFRGLSPNKFQGTPVARAGREFPSWGVGARARSADSEVRPSTSPEVCFPFPHPVRADVFERAFEAPPAECFRAEGGEGDAAPI